MKLLRRKREPTPVQRVLDILRAAVRGLVAVRVARSAFKTYKFARRLPLLIALGAAGAGIAALVKASRSRRGVRGYGRRRNGVPIVASRSFLIDVHLLDR